MVIIEWVWNLPLFIEILTQITLPIIVLVVLGWGARLRLQLSVETLNKLLLNIILPCFFVHYLSTAKIPLAEVWPTAWFTVLQYLALFLIGWVIAGLVRVPRETRIIVAIAMAFPNTGNFGIPVAQLAFPADLLLHQAVIVSLQTVLIVLTSVLFIMPKNSDRSAWGEVAKNPMIWGVIIGLALKAFGVQLPAIVAKPVELITGAYAALALFTLGAGLAGGRAHVETGALSIAVVLKLIVSPAVTWGLAFAFGFRGLDLEFLVVAAAAPVGILFAIFCLIYDFRPRLVAAMVFVATVLSPLSVSAWILIMRLH